MYNTTGFELILMEYFYNGVDQKRHVIINNINDDAVRKRCFKIWFPVINFDFGLARSAMLNKFPHVRQAPGQAIKRNFMQVFIGGICAELANKFINKEVFRGLSLLENSRDKLIQQLIFTVFFD